MKEKVLAAMLALVLVGGGGYLAVTSTGAEAGGRSDPRGIPDHNPSHQPEDGDGECEKGETVIKTTPSGKRVNVPCQAGDHDDDDDDESQGNHDDDDDDGEEAGDDGGHGNGKGKGKGNGKNK